MDGGSEVIGKRLDGKKKLESVGVATPGTWHSHKWRRW